MNTPATLVATPRWRTDSRTSVLTGRLAVALASVDEPRAALRIVAELAIESSSGDRCAVILAHGTEREIVWAVDRKHDRIEVPEDGPLASIAAEALRENRPVVRHESDGDALPTTATRARDKRATICVPMSVAGRAVGAICIANAIERSHADARELRELSVIAAMAAPFALEAVRGRAADNGIASDSLVGESDVMLELRRLVERVAPTDLSVLVVGETGTGKDVIARAIHDLSPRRDKALVALNCSAVPEGLLESELFGSSKGAFTGALRDRPGRIEAAQASTLFLDEVGDMPISMQAALLRAVEEHAVVRVGEVEPRSIDFRLVAATNKNLDAEVGASRFREDLLFRLREVTITVPPLRERGDDALLLARLFLRQAERQLWLPAHGIGNDVDAAIAAHRWPGNVRELRATMRRAAVLCEGAVIHARDLGLESNGNGQRTEPTPVDGIDVSTKHFAIRSLAQPLADARDEFVSHYVGAVLDACHGDRKAAATSLQISPRSLYRYLESVRRKSDSEPIATVTPIHPAH